MSSHTRKAALLSTRLRFPQLSAQPGLPGILWAAPATASTVPEHGAEHGWKGNGQLMGTQRMVKTFASGDAVVWRFLSGTWPSQHPVVLCLFFSTLSMSIFQFAHPLCRYSCHFGCFSCLMSCSLQLRYCHSFVYLQQNSASITGVLFANHQLYIHPITA